MLYLLLDRRNRDLKQTMISSNLSLREIADNFDDRVASRIAEECQPVKFRGQDKRTAKSRTATENTKKRQEVKKVVPWR
jgi:DNA replication protein DnaC